LEIATGDKEMSGYQLRVLRNASELEIIGPIGFRLTKEVRKLLDSHPTITTIHLNSNGGRVGEARKLSKFIAARGLKTYTATGCYSACVIAFAGGSERLINPNAAIGLHQYAFPGVQSVDFNTEYYEDKRYFISRGVAADFLEKAYATPNESMWEPSHKELFEANLITSYPKRGEVAMSGVRPEDLDELEAELLLSNPLFLALKNHEPEIYKSMLAEIKEGFLRGMSLQEMRVKTLPLVELAYERRLPYASDEALIAFFSVLIEEMEFYYSRDPILCYWSLYETNSERPPSWTRMPDEIQDREFDAAAMLINSAASGLYYPPTEEQIQTIQDQVMTRLTQE